MLNKTQLGFLFLLCAQSAVAGSLTIGGGVAFNESIYKGYNKNNHFAPVAHYESSNIYFRQTTLGFIFAKDSSNELSLIGSWLPWSFDPSDNDDSAMKRLDKRQSSVMAGAAWYHYADWGNIKFTASRDVLDNSNGWVADLSLFRVLPMGRLALTPSVGVSYYDDNFNQYYYGISADESRRSGLAQYSPEGSWNPYVGLTAKYSLTTNLMLTVSAIYTVLPDEVKNSPMVDHRDSSSLVSTLSWRF